MREENQFTAEDLLGELLDGDPAIKQRLETERHRERIRL